MEREAIQVIEDLKEALRARIVDTMILKNQLIWILETLAKLLEQGRRDT